MTNHYYITGSSSGIGKALAEELLTDPNNVVHGISRSETISHERYRHTTVDFAWQEPATSPSYLDLLVPLVL